jgi:glycosyltransferase involved in cell wall biosynthesis
MSDSGSGTNPHVCIVNVGLFRSGTTTLAKAANILGLKVCRKSPHLSEIQYKLLLQEPERVVLDWYVKGGVKEIIQLVSEFDLICDGWIALLPFLPPSTLERCRIDAQQAGVEFKFVASIRAIVETTVQSELHWTIYDLERKAGLTATDRKTLESDLRKRATEHQVKVQHLRERGVLTLLQLTENIEDSWSISLPGISGFTEEDWSEALRKAGRQNANPVLPVEGILLTFRLGSGNTAERKIISIEQLLDQLEQDSLCRYLLIVGIDADEEGCEAAVELEKRLKSRAGQERQLQSFRLITNHPPDSRDLPFAICAVWNDMAVAAWEDGADWVVLLGDDIEIECSYHYRAFYRCFLDISERLKVPFGFGLAAWNDKTFPGFPSFPCVGRAHYHIFGALIPKHRQSIFVNQDLDPYLQHLYFKFGAAPFVSEASLVNKVGGNIGSGEARYERIPAKGWRDFVLDDVDLVRKHLPEEALEILLLDVIVPSYRVRLDCLESICSLKVPANVHTNFIIIVDNVDALHREVDRIRILQGSPMETAPETNHYEQILEQYLSRCSGSARSSSSSNVRVRCNATNLGASASRNRGLDESAAEFILHLDDDLYPNPDLLEQYCCKLGQILADRYNKNIVGLVGLVQFPRSPHLPLRHAAVLMSYLTFMFEIAARDMYQHPAWGVTANILFQRTSVRFDLAYAKTGGGEDVDYSLRVAAATQGGMLVAVPEATVVHPFWPGSVLTLAHHFFSWAIGDGALFQRFPQYRYWSYPNVPETVLLSSPLVFLIGPLQFVKLVPVFLAADFVVDFCHREEYRHRCLQLQHQQGGKGDGLGDNNAKSSAPQHLEFSAWYCFRAFALSCIYVNVLECGRLWGHVSRSDLLRYGLCRRFDWHCGLLPKAPGNFRRREACKFALFVGIVSAEVLLLVRHWSDRSTRSNRSVVGGGSAVGTSSSSCAESSSWNGLVFFHIVRSSR